MKFLKWLELGYANQQSILDTEVDPWYIPIHNSVIYDSYYQETKNENIGPSY